VAARTDNKDGTFDCNYCNTKFAHKHGAKVREHLVMCKSLSDEDVKTALCHEATSGKGSAVAATPPAAKRSQTIEQAASLAA